VALDFIGDVPQWVYNDNEGYGYDMNSSFSLSPTPTHYYDSVEEIFNVPCPYGTPDSGMFQGDGCFASAAGFAYDINQEVEQCPRSEKGKCRVDIHETEDLDVYQDSIDQNNADSFSLTREDKTEQSRRDEDLALRLIVEELKEGGYSDGFIQRFLFERASSALQRSESIDMCSSLPLSKCEMAEAEAPYDPHLQARRLLDSIYTRPLPPAYGPAYIPEPSTSIAGSPILVSRRASASSCEQSDSGTSNGSRFSRISNESSCEYAIDEEEIQRALEQQLDADFEVNKAELLTDLERIEQENERLKARSKEKNRKGTWYHLLGVAGHSLGWPTVSFHPARGDSLTPHATSHEIPNDDASPFEHSSRIRPDPCAHYQHWEV
jgi:hypothetical protein